MKVTMDDVAKHVGVSKSTVSQYLNKRYEFMSEKTRQKVEKAIEELNYHPNLVAKSLKQKKTNMVAIICASLASNFSIELISSIEQFFQNLNYTVVISCTNDDAQKERQLIESFISRQFDGILVFPTAENKQFYQNISKSDMPIIFMDRYLKDVSINSVLLDNEQAGLLATNYLIEKHHKKIGILLFPLGDRITTRVERLNGYLKALKNKNIEPNQRYIICCEKNKIDEKLTELFMNEEPPTALFLTNDVILEATLTWMKKHSVNQKVLLISVDDVLIAKFYEPAIATIAQPVKQMGEKAAQLLWDAINLESDSEYLGQIRFEPTLIER